MWTHQANGRRNRQRAGAFAVVVAGAMSVASVASACTAVMGQLVLSPTSGPAGSSITASATGLKVAPAKYRLIFISSKSLANGGGCHDGGSQTLVRTIKTDSKGSFFGIKAQIPSTAPQGVSQICGLEKYPVKNQTATTHQSFTVT